MEEFTDIEIVNKCINGNKDAFSVLLGRYKNLVYSVILRMVNDKFEAEDLAQEVFIKIYTNLKKYNPEFKFSTWIMRIATNHVIDYRRKSKQELISIDETNEDGLSLFETLKTPDDLTPEVAFINKEESKNLKEVVDELPDMYKIPIVLYHENGLSYQEISDVTQQPLSKTKNRIFRGRKMLKDALIGRGVKSYGML